MPHWTGRKYRVILQGSIQTHRFYFVLFYLIYLKFQMDLSHDHFLFYIHLMTSQIYKLCNPLCMEQEQSLKAKSKPKTRTSLLPGLQGTLPAQEDHKKKILSLEKRNHRIPSYFSLRHSRIQLKQCQSLGQNCISETQTRVISSILMIHKLGCTLESPIKL